LTVKYETSKEVRSTFVGVVTAVLIKFDCLWISSSFLSKNYNGLFEEIHDLLLSAYAYFLHWNYCLWELHHTQHTGEVYELISKTECQKVCLIFSHPSFFSAGERSTVALVAPNIDITFNTFRLLYKPWIRFYTTA
jgi:hypothetical protein